MRNLAGFRDPAWQAQKLIVRGMTESSELGRNIEAIARNVLWWTVRKENICAKCLRACALMLNVIYWGMWSNRQPVSRVGKDGVPVCRS